MRFSKMASSVAPILAACLVGASSLTVAPAAQAVTPDAAQLWNKVSAFPLPDVKPTCAFEIPLQEVPLGALTFVMPPIVNWGIYQGSGDSYVLTVESADVIGDRYGTIVMFGLHYHDFGTQADTPTGAVKEFVGSRIAAAEGEGFKHVNTEFHQDDSGNISVARATFTHPEGIDMLALIAAHSKTNEMGYMLVFLSSELCEKGALEAFTVRQTDSK